MIKETTGTQTEGHQVNEILALRQEVIRMTEEIRRLNDEKFALGGKIERLENELRSAQEDPKELYNQAAWKRIGVGMTEATSVETEPTNGDAKVLR